MTARASAVAPGSVDARRSTGIWRDAFGRLAKNRLAVLGLGFVIFLAVLGIFGPRFAPWPYDSQDTPALIANKFLPLVPFQNPAHPLGTDSLGQDILSRLMDGAQISLSVALVVQVVVLFIGTAHRRDRRLVRRSPRHLPDALHGRHVRVPDLLLIILMSVAFRDTAFGRLSAACSWCSWPSASRPG